jgi:RNA polymerase sigma factor (TIGR02999 family)
VHETYMQLAVETGVDWQDRSHFFAICARAMRRLVVDEVRHRRAKKRGWAMAHLTLRTDLDVDVHTDQELVLAVDRAVERLAAFNERLARVVECRSFAGMTDEETARALGTSVRTAQRDWTRARAWLRKELEGGTGEGQILARRK